MKNVLKFQKRKAYGKNFLSNQQSTHKKIREYHINHQNLILSEETDMIK